MKASLKILQRSNYQTKEGEQQVCLRYTSYRRSTFVGFNISVHPKDWNENKKPVKATEPHHIHYNKLIKEQKFYGTFSLAVTPPCPMPI